MAEKINLYALFAMLEVAFKTEPDATGAGYKFMKVSNCVFQPMAAVVARDGQTNDLTRQPHVMAGKGGKVSGEIELKASGTPAASTVAAIAAEADLILQAVLGTVVRGSGALLTAGSTTTVLKVASTAAFSVGMAVEVAGEQRVIIGVPNGTDLTLDRALSGAPAAGVVCYASSLYKRANTGHKSVSFVGKRGTGIEYTMLGCKPASLKIAGIQAGGIAKLQFEFDVGSWSVTAKGALPSTDPTGITAVKPPVVKGSPLAVAGASKVVSGIDFDFGISFTYQDSTEDVDNKAGMELVQSEPKGAIKPYYNAQHLTDFVAGTEQSLVFTCGDRNSGFALYVPKVQYDQPAFEDRNGLVGESIPFFVNDNGAAAEYALSLF